MSSASASTPVNSPPTSCAAGFASWCKYDNSRLTLIVQSFGFKHGIPLDADFVFDVRCLPNPYYDPVYGR